jgi:hypothetical protein
MTEEILTKTTYLHISQTTNYSKNPLPTLIEAGRGYPVSGVRSALGTLN